MNRNCWGRVKKLAVVRQRGADGAAYGEEDDEPIIRVPRQKLGKMLGEIENVYKSHLCSISHPHAHNLCCSLARMQQSMLLSHSPAHNSPCCSLTRPHTTVHVALSLAQTTAHVAFSLARMRQPMLLSHSHAHHSPCCFYSHQVTQCKWQHN
jgi:hypothetical protein